jgi:hypothetical protein
VIGHDDRAAIDRNGMTELSASARSIGEQGHLLAPDARRALEHVSRTGILARNRIGILSADDRIVPGHTNGGPECIRLLPQGSGHRQPSLLRPNRTRAREHVSGASDDGTDFIGLCTGDDSVAVDIDGVSKTVAPIHESPGQFLLQGPDARRTDVNVDCTGIDTARIGKWAANRHRVAGNRDRPTEMVAERQIGGNNALLQGPSVPAAQPHFDSTIASPASAAPSSLPQMPITAVLLSTATL